MFRVQVRRKMSWDQALRDHWRQRLRVVFNSGRLMALELTVFAWFRWSLRLVTMVSRLLSIYWRQAMLEGYIGVCDIWYDISCFELADSLSNWSEGREERCVWTPWQGQRLTSPSSIATRRLRHVIPNVWPWTRHVTCCSVTLYNPKS